MISALVLNVMDFNEDCTLFVITVLSRMYLPNYFSEKMEGLLCDLDVFHVLMADRLPTLYAHLQNISQESNDPPVINMFVSS